jgi:hypothetical protein
MTKFWTRAAPMTAALAVFQAGAAFADDEALMALADQLRLQGYACEHPKSATPDDSLSKPNERVWTVACDGASYRVRVIPDMAAQVEKLKK